MGEKLTKKSLPLVVQDSLSFSASQTSSVGDDTLSDNQKLWEYIRKKRNYNKKKDNFIEVLSQGLNKQNFDVQIESCNVGISTQNKIGDVVQNAQDNITKSNHDESKKEIEFSDITETNLQQRNKLNADLNNKNNGSPLKRRSISRSRTNKKSFEKRVLLNEFEKTLLQENQFNPSCMSTPVCHKLPDQNTDNDSSAFIIQSPPLEENDVETAGSLSKSGRSSLEQEENNLNKNLTTLNKNSMEISKHSDSTLKNELCLLHQSNLRLTRNQRKYLKSKNNSECAKCKKNTITNQNCNSMELEQIDCNSNIDFTIVPQTQEDSNIVNEDEHEETMIIPETQNLQENVQFPTMNKNISITRNVNEIQLKKNGENSWELCKNVLRFSPTVEECENNFEEHENQLNKEKNFNDSESREQNINKTDGINYREQNSQDNISPKRSSLSKINETTPSKQRRTYTIIRSSNDLYSNINNEEIQSEDNAQNDEYIFEETPKKNSSAMEKISNQSNQQKTFTINPKSPEQFSPTIRNIQKANETLPVPKKIISSTSKVSKIPQIKRIGNLATLKNPTPYKVKDTSHQNQSPLPIIVSVESLAEKINPHNNSNSPKNDKFDEVFNKDVKSSSADRIIDRIRKSIVTTPVVVMIDNKRNKINETSRNKDDDKINTSKFPPPPEFSDSFQDTTKNMSISRRKINLSRKPKNKKNKTNIDNVDMLMTSDEDVENETGAANIVVRDTSLPLRDQNKIPKTDKNLSRKSLVVTNSPTRKDAYSETNNSTRKNPDNDQINTTLLDFSSKTRNQRKSSGNNTFNKSSTSKIFIPENYSIQPVDLRKRRSRTSSILANIKINTLSQLRASNKNVTEEKYNKIYQDYETKCNFVKSNLQINISDDDISDYHRKSNLPLVNVFREIPNNQSFTKELQKAKIQSRKSKNSLSNLPSPPSYLLHNDINQTEEHSGFSILHMREQNSRSNSTFPAPPSFLLRDEFNSTLPAKESNVISAEYGNEKNSSNKRLSKYCQFQLENEKKKNRNRSCSASVLRNSSRQKERNISSEQKICKSYSNSEINNQELPLPPAEAYFRQNEVIINIPQQQENSSGYASTYFQSNKRKKSLRSRLNSRSRKLSSSSDSPEPKRVFRKHYRLIKKSKSMPLLAQKQFNELRQEQYIANGNSSSSSSSVLTTHDIAAAEEIEKDLNEDTDHIYDDSETVNSCWKKSIEIKLKEKNENNKEKSKVRQKKKQHVDLLKETYLNLTESIQPPSSLYIEKSNRRKLYSKGASDNETIINSNLIDRDENILPKSVNNKENIKNKSIKNKKNSKEKRIATDISGIFSNITESPCKSKEIPAEALNDDFIFKKPNLPAAKSKKSKFNKKTTSENNNNSDKNITYSQSNNENNTQEISKTQNYSINRKIKKSEIQSLMNSVPRSYKPILNKEINESITNPYPQSVIRRSSRKPAPRRVYKYSKYSTNEYELLPSLTEYNDMITNQIESVKKKKVKKNSKLILKENILNDNNNDGSNVRSIKKQKERKNKINTEAEENCLNPETIFPDFVQGVEIQNSNHFIDKQNIKKSNENKKLSTDKISQLDKQHSNNSCNISNAKDITQIVDSIKESFNKFETTVLSNVGSNTECTDNVQKQNKINEQNINKKYLKTSEKLKLKNKIKLDKKSQKEKKIISQNDEQNLNKNTTKNHIQTTDEVCTNNSNQLISSNQTTNYSKNSENNCEKSQDLFHWVRQLATASTKIKNMNANNSGNNNSKSDVDDDIQRYFAENTFRITDISKMQVSEKNGVQYAFYKEERSRDFGYIKFKSGSQKPRTKSKTFDLHFLFIFGVLEFHIDGQVYNSKAGNFVSIPKGKYYSMVNNSNDTACLFFIKVSNEEMPSC